MAGKKLVGASGLTEFAGDITDTDLNLYVVDESNTTLDSEGSGFRMLIHKNLVVTDGTNPVQIVGGGTIDLNGEDLAVTPGTGGDLVTTAGEQTITNKTFAMVVGEVGPIMSIRATDMWFYRSDTAPNNGRFRFGGGLLDNLVDHLFHVPNNDGQSTLIDSETTQTLTNKTLDDTNTVELLDDNFTLSEEYAGGTKTIRFEIDSPNFPDGVTSIPIRNVGEWMGRVGDTLHVQDNSLIIYDVAPTSATVNTGRRAKFEVLGSVDEIVTFNLPILDSSPDTLVVLNTEQTLLNKTLDDTCTVSRSTILLKQSTAPTPTDNGDIRWDSDDNILVIGTGTTQAKFYPGPTVLRSWLLFSSGLVANATEEVVLDPNTIMATVQGRFTVSGGQTCTFSFTFHTGPGTSSASHFVYDTAGTVRATVGYDNPSGEVRLTAGVTNLSGVNVDVVQLRNI